MKEKLYHVSHIPNLKILEPKKSTHGKSYVYATKFLEVALFFGSDKSFGDFDGMYGGGETQKPFFYEAYAGALKRRFENVTCYIYEVDPKDFKENKTSYSAEVVSEKPVQVLKCTVVKNLYDKIISLYKKGKIDLRFYDKDNENYVTTINKHIKHRLKIFNTLKNKQTNQYKFCKEKFSEIIKELANENLK